MPATDLIQRAPPAHAISGALRGGWNVGLECWHSWLFTCWWFFVRRPSRRSAPVPPPNLTHLVTFVLARAFVRLHMTFDFPLSRQSDTLRERDSRLRVRGTKDAESLYHTHTPPLRFFIIFVAVSFVKLVIFGRLLLLRRNSSRFMKERFRKGLLSLLKFMEKTRSAV